MSLPGGHPAITVPTGYGQLCSTSAKAVGTSLAPVVMSTAALQKLPAPTAPGIRSEASKRTGSPSARISPKPAVDLVGYRLVSTFLFGDRKPPTGARALAYSLAGEEVHHLDHLGPVDQQAA